MTSEERLDRIEHITAGIAEERRKDRDEYKALWRDTQRQLNEVSTRLVQLSEADEEARAADKRLDARIQQLADESRAANKQLEARIETLVSAFGELIRHRQ
jgi:chromosome segregation ATPase